MEAIRIQLMSLRSAGDDVHHILQMKEGKRNTVISFLWVWWDTRKKSMQVNKHDRWLRCCIEQQSWFAVLDTSTSG
jgi:hypothetical protein